MIVTTHRAVIIQDEEKIKYIGGWNEPGLLDTTRSARLRIYHPMRFAWSSYLLNKNRARGARSFSPFTGEGQGLQSVPYTLTIRQATIGSLRQVSVTASIAIKTGTDLCKAGIGWYVLFDVRASGKTSGAKADK